MTPGEATRAALKTLFNGRVYANTFAQGDGPSFGRLPAARFQIVSSVNEGSICGTDGRETDETRLQLDIVAGDWDSLDALLDQVMAAMMNLDPPCTREIFFTTFDEETRTHRAVFDFRFQASSPVVS